MGTVEFDDDCVFTDRLFCGPAPCGFTTGGDWTLDGASPCLPEQSPCGALIGAQGWGCGAPLPTGACCLPDGSCLVTTEPGCAGQNGVYGGDGIPCEPDPCGAIPAERTSWGRMKARYRGSE